VKILILGGTVFLGRHLVADALERGHDVTLFNRGQHDPDLYPETEKLRGNRDGNLEALQGRRWDAVIDTCGYLPRVVRASAALLSGAVNHYTFISSIAVYSTFSKLNIDESAPLGTMADETLEKITNETYGPLRALCEQAIEDEMPGRTLSIRAGMIVGPHDRAGGFTYWPRRVAQGGTLLAPGRHHRRIQLIDARDLAGWIVRLVESGQSGVFNATGPDYPLTMEHLLEDCRAVCGSDAHFVWVDDDFLIKEGAEPWTEIPLWIPEDDASRPGLFSIDCGKAGAAGLTIRPLADTIRDTLAWDSTLLGPSTYRFPSGLSERIPGLKRERELQLLQAWCDRA